MHTLFGGQMENDRERKLYQIYPEGHWVEIGTGTPYHIIGSLPTIPLGGNGDQ